jgi:DNA-binding FrmR family transcriptional regulator
MAKKLTDQKQSAVVSTRKAVGTLQKVLLMIEEDKYCPEIIQQLDAALGLLKSTKRTLLVGHLDHCLEHQIKQDKNQTVQELLQILNLNGK